MARLTEEQKNILDKRLYDYLENITSSMMCLNDHSGDEYFHLDLTSIGYHNASIRASLDRLLNNQGKNKTCYRFFGLVRRVELGRYEYYLIRTNTTTTIIKSNKVFKDHEKLYFDTNYYHSLWYDFKEKAIFLKGKNISREITKDGKELITNFTCLSNYVEHNIFIVENTNIPIDEEENYYTFSDLSRIINNVNRELHNYEWITNYTDNLNIISNFLLGKWGNINYDTEPKGFHKWFVKQNKPFDIEIVEEYTKMQRIGENNYKYFNENFPYVIKYLYLPSWRTMRELLVSNKNFYKIINKLVKNSSSCFLEDEELQSRAIIRNFFFNVNNFRNSKEVIIDTGKDFENNNKSLESLSNKNFNEQLKKINFINDLINENENFIVKVPQTQEDKIEEGKQQHNCVGYYYDDSIKQGKDFIYFIRTNKNPNKSLVTCRYNYYNKKTVEYRTKCNGLIVDNEIIDFINDIDKIINEHYSEL